MDETTNPTLKEPKETKDPKDPTKNPWTDGSDTRRAERSFMKKLMEELAAIKVVNTFEGDVGGDLEKEIRLTSRTWERYCGMVEGINFLTRIYPYADNDLMFKFCIRLVAIVASKLALEAIQIEEERECFPEEFEE